MCDSQFLIVTYCDTSLPYYAQRLRPKNLSLRPWKFKQWRRGRKKAAAMSRMGWSLPTIF